MQENLMDERLAKALDFSNYMKTLSDQKRLLTEKYHANLIYYYNGCQFTVTPTLLSFVKLLVDKKVDFAVLVDDNDVPAKVENVKTFLKNILDVYFQASNEYANDYEKLKNSRTIEKLINYD
jgi:hypothetical protein